MADEFEALANSKFVEEEYQEAAELYTKAIGLRPTPRLYSSRSLTHSNLGNHQVSLQDATKAISLDPNFSKAYLRRGIAHFNLGNYKSAREDFISGSKIDSKNTTFKLWIEKCDSNLENKINENEKHAKYESGLQSISNTPSDDRQNQTSSSQIPQSPSQTLLPDSQPRIRHEWYQTPEKVVVTVFAKNIRPENIEHQFGEQILSLKINQEESEFSMVTRLFEKIVPDQCKLIVMSTKIEIRLIKASPVHWSNLEYVQNQLVKQPINVSNENAKPSYPSSKKHVDWDKLEASVKKEEKDEKLEGDAALNKLFQDIYANADEDTRRAMNKSFVESKGSVLSTNWKEVGSKKVDPYK